MFLTDRITVDKPRRTNDGYLVADARVARTGIQEYLGSELGRSDMPKVRVYRPPEEVFSSDAMHSYAYRPMTHDHPASMVNADNWRAVAIGQTGGEVVRDGEFVRVPLVMMDAQAIKQWEQGKRELSMGYTAEIVFEDGVTPEGEHYDAIQTNLRMNHLALVARARGGDQLRIGDDNLTPEKSNMSEKSRTILVDGLSVETTEAGAQAIQKLQGVIEDSRKALDDANSNHAKALADKDAEIAKRDAEIESLKAKVLTDADLDSKVKARADLIARAKAVADQDYSGKTEMEIRRSAVVAVLGDSMKDKTDAYVEARFDILCEDAKADPVRKAVSTPTKTTDSQTAYEARIANAWKHKEAV